MYRRHSGRRDTHFGTGCVGGAPVLGSLVFVDVVIELTYPSLKRLRWWVLGAVLHPAEWTGISGIYRPLTPAIGTVDVDSGRDIPEAL